MKKWIHSVIAAFMLSILPFVSTQAQDAPPPIFLEAVDASQYPLVRIELSAWNSSGMKLPNPNATDFTIQVDGGKELTPKTLETNTQAPLSVALVLDVSGSMGGTPLEDAKQAANRFLEKLDPGDQVALIAFSDPVDPDPEQINPQREQPLTRNFEPIFDIIENLQAGGHTQLYNASAKAVNMLADQPDGHRAILLLSDGVNDPPEAGDPELCIQLAQQARIPFFIIGLGNEIDEAYLRRLATETGGVLRTTPKSSELSTLFNEMAAILKTQYILTYESDLPGDGGMHTLTISLQTPYGLSSDSLEVGPFPQAAAPEPTPLPTFEKYVPAAQPAQGAPACDSPLVLFGQTYCLPWGWMLASLASILLAGMFYIRQRRRGRTALPEVCAQCGYDLTGLSGACPQCGGKRRVPKR